VSTHRSLLALALVAAGCNSGPMGGALDVTPSMYSYDQMALSRLSDGDPIDLTHPPQGGFVLFVGAEVRNLHDATVQLSGKLYDATGTHLLGQDKRSVLFQPSKADPDVWVPDLRSYVNMSNIPVCPSADTDDRFNRAATIEITVVENSSGRSGSGRRQVLPSCRQADAMMLQLCQCECAAGFSIAKCGGIP
jgi:hypothetical protein